MLIFAFLLSTIALIFQSILFPQIAILTFSPFLALTILRSSLYKALWLAILAGSLMDLISNDPIGAHALTYVAVTFLLFKIRKMFSHDEPFHLSLFTSIISLNITAFQLFFLFLFDRRVPLEGRWIFADFLGMPVIDGLYAFVWFAAPLSLFSKYKKMWSLFWLRRKRAFRSSR